MLEAVIAAVEQSSGIAGKADIASVLDALPAPGNRVSAVPLGDDCAAIPDGEGYLLLAMEGFVNRLVAEAPQFAGYCGVLVNVSDIAAMGGRPTAVVNAVWSDGAEQARPLLAGLAEAAQVYGVPIVGGHSNLTNDRGQLAVAILGRARRLLTSFDARPGDTLIAAVDLRGRYREPWPNWDASSGHDPQRLRGDLELLPALAEDGLCAAAKDISMGGLVGTALMLAECSGVGMRLDLAAVPRPQGVEPARWLVDTFPSYGFLLAVPPDNAAAVVQRFNAREIACAAIGHCDDRRVVRLTADGREHPVRDFNRSRLIGCGPAAEKETQHA